MTRRFADLAGPDTAGILTDRSILVLPTGAIEHHGPHLPLSTDTLIAEESANAAVAEAARRGLDVWQLPTLSVTKSDEHSWAPGTLWLRPETLLDGLVDLGRSLLTTPARKLVFMNGHGGNVALLQVACRELRRRFGFQTFAMPASNVPSAVGADGAADEYGLGIHAGHAETSIVMHLRPELVHPERFARNVPEELAGFDYIGFTTKPVTFGWLSDDFGSSGVLGDPTTASAAAGEAMFERGVATAVAILDEIDRFKLAPRAATTG